MSDYFVNGMPAEKSRGHQGTSGSLEIRATRTKQETEDESEVVINPADQRVEALEGVEPGLRVDHRT